MIHDGSGAGYWALDEPAQSEGATVPIATPEIYNEMLDKAKAGEFAYPAINVTCTETLQRRAARLRGGGERRHRPDLHRRRGVPVRHARSRTWSPARSRSPSSRTSSPRSTRSTSRCTPTTAPRTSSTATSGRCSRSARSGSTAASSPLFQSHMWDGSATELHENLAIAAELLDLAVKAKIILEVEIGVVGGEEDGVANEINEKLYTSAVDYEATVEALGAGREGPLPARRHLRQRARRLQAGQRQAAPGDPQAGPGAWPARSSASPPGRSRSTWSSTAARARCPRRSPRR